MVLSPVESIGYGALAFLVYLLIRYPDRGVGTSPSNLKTVRRGWPLFGNLFYLLSTRSRIYEYQLLGQEDAGDEDYTFTMPFLRMINLRKPEHIEYVQKTNFQNYIKGSLQRDIFRDVLGTGIFASDGHTWNAQRKATSYIFSAGSFRTVISRAIDKHTDILVKVLGKSADAGTEVALNDMFFRLTLDTFCHMSFGQELGSLEADEPVPFAKAFDYAQSRLDRRFAEPGWRLWEKLNGHGRKMKDAIKIIDDFSYGIIDARDRQSADEKGGEKPVDLLALYRGIRDEKGQPMSRKELRDAVINLIIAGRDTTAQSLAWLYFHVIENPSLLDPVRKEIEELLHDGQVTYDNHNSLVQTKALFLETVRLHASVAKNGKTCVQDDQIPNGPIVRKGDVVAWSDWALSRNTRIWGENAKQFLPSRWIDEDGSIKRFSQFVFHSFNAGPRLCLGQSLAIFEGVTVIVALTKHFDLTFAPGYLETVPRTTGIVETGTRAPLYATSLTLPMAQPLRVNIARRSV